MEELTFGRRYRVTEKIGSGGMADVYKAVDEVLGRTVAVKVMHARLAADPTFAARFRQEAQAAANLVSPYIVNIYDWGQEGSTYYIVMEYVRGTDLKSIITQRGALPAEKVADVGAQVCAALMVAHGYDIIHRDIKPHNIMVQPDGSVKVMDFGIARAGNSTMTQTGSVLGTAHYVSPEQAQGKELHGSSDLYSLGVVLYEAATGKMPFDADTPVAVALKQVNEQPRAPHEIKPNIDPGLEAVILKAMQKNPLQRYASADQMRRDLLQVAAGRALAISMEPKGAAAGAAATAVLPSVGRDDPSAAYRSDRRSAAPKRRRVWPWVVAGVLLLALIGLGAAWATGLLGSKSIMLPDVVGMTQQEAQALLEKDGFKVTVTSEYSSDTTAGVVMSQDPEGDIKVPKGTTVALVVSQGADLVDVPNVVGLTESEAYNTLKAAGFSPQALPSEYNPDVAEGNIIRQDPVEGAKANRGSVVNYVASRGTEMAKLPDVTNTTESQATATLQDAGFTVTPVKAYSDTVEKGRVISQSPQGGGSFPKGSAVTITISQGSDKVKVPYVKGLSEDAARSAIEGAGLKVSIVYEPHSNSGNVIDQDPSASTSDLATYVKIGSIVTITVDSNNKAPE